MGEIVKGGGGGAPAVLYVGIFYRNFLSDICSCFVFRNASASVVRRGLTLRFETCLSPFPFRLLGFNDTKEVKYRNARLSHQILNCYI